MTPAAAAFPLLSPLFFLYLESEMVACSLESVLVKMMLTEALPWPFNEIQDVYGGYLRQRFATKAIRLPWILELKLLAMMANLALLNGDEAEYDRLIDLAVGESAGLPEMQSFLLVAKEQRTPVLDRRIITILSEPSDSVTEEGSEQSSPQLESKDTASEAELTVQVPETSGPPQVW